VGKKRPVPAINQDGEYILNPLDASIMQAIDPTTGQLLEESYVEIEDVPVYLGPRVKRIDPRKLFVKADKTRDNAEPIMISSVITKKEILERKKIETPSGSRGIYINTDRLEFLDTMRQEGGSEKSDYIYNRDRVKGMAGDRSFGKDYIEYLEWQGPVNKLELYEYLDKPTEIEQLVDGEMQRVPVADKDEDCAAIVGVIDRKLIIRLEDSPFEGRDSNVVIGLIEEDEDSLIGTSISDKVIAVAEAKDRLAGMHLENLKQSVNAGAIINLNAIVSETGTDGPVINKPGWILGTNQDVNNVYKRVEQPRVAPDILNYSDRLTQEGQSASGLGEYVQGQGDPAASTLGEANIIQAQQTIRLNSYLKTFEETFIQPVYELRNQINIQYLDQEYVYGIIGDSAIEWRTIQPEQIRASVDFLCESSSRETNRGIVTQQILQLTQLAPNMTINGIPVPQRIDKLLARLAESGFSWNRDQIEEWLPLFKFERHNSNLPVDDLLVQNFLTSLQLQAAMNQLGPMLATQQGTGEQLPQPRNDEELNQSMNQRNATQAGRM